MVIQNPTTNSHLILQAYSDDQEQLSPERRLGAISRILEGTDYPVQSALDIGTGYGYGAIALHDKGVEKVLGVETNLDKLRDGIEMWAQEGYPVNLISSPEEYLEGDKGIYFLNGDAKKLTLENSFDLVTTFYISGYMLGNGTFQDVGRYLTPGGRMIISTDGPKELKEDERGRAVGKLEREFRPRGLVLEDITEIPGIHDKFVVFYQRPDYSRRNQHL